MNKNMVASRGVTLIELLVATTLSLILLLSGAAFYGQVKSKIPVIREAKLIQQRARIALDVLDRLTAIAGLSYCREIDAEGAAYQALKVTNGELIIQTPLTDWRGVSYIENRSGMSFESPITNKSKKISQCGDNVEITYFVGNYGIKLEGTDLKIRGFKVGGNEHILIRNVSAFKFSFGIAEEVDTYQVSKYVTNIPNDSNLLRTVKYEITISDPSGNNQDITLTKVVRLHNPVVLEI